MTPGSLVLRLVVALLGFVLQGAMVRMALRQLRTGQANIGDMFSVVDVLPSLLLAGFLYTLALYAGLACCILPGIYISLGLTLTIPLIVDQNRAPLDALSESWGLMQGNLLNTFFVLFVATLIAILGVLFCCVGVLITGPMPTVCIALIYRNLTGPGMIRQSTGYVPPIADPNG